MIKNFKKSSITSLLTLVTFCVLSSAVSAQDGVSKKTQAAFSKGLQLQSYGEYLEAIELFKTAIKKSPSFIDAYDALANTYQKIGDYKKAISSYKCLLSIKADHRYSLFELGNIYFESQKLDSAEFYYKTFLQLNKTNDRNSKAAVRNLQNISFIRDALSNPRDITPINMEESINTKEQEYSPAFAIDENIMYITRRVGNLKDSRPNEDIYYSNLEEGEWSKIKNLGPPINTAENEGAFSVSADGHYIFFTSCSRPGGKGQCDIWITIDRDGEWSEPMNLQAPINTKNWESQPSISSNGKLLYFTSDRPGGYGGTDIWVAEFGENGWEKPVNLGPEINTSLDEQFPFIHPDNSTLYFSSEGHPGMGKSDLFISKREQDNSWSIPKNLGYPINTAGYDWNMIVSRDGKTAYYSSDNLLSSFGGLDIYSFLLPEDLRAKKVSYVRGFVRDAKTKKPLSASVLLTPQDGSLSTSTYADKSDGTFLAPLISNKKYALTIDKEGYLFHSDYFDMPNVSTDEPFEIYVDLEKLEIGKKVVLRNVFFDTDKFNLKSESTSELNKLVEFMTNNPEVVIEISGHTDNIGSTKDNKILSTNRSKEVYEYLVREGISKGRISYIGFGDTQPIADNSTEEGRSQNRRTEFKVIIME